MASASACTINPFGAVQSGRSDLRVDTNNIDFGNFHLLMQYNMSMNK